MAEKSRVRTAASQAGHVSLDAFIKANVNGQSECPRAGLSLKERRKQRELFERVPGSPGPIHLDKARPQDNDPRATTWRVMSLPRQTTLPA